MSLLLLFCSPVRGTLYVVFRYDDFSADAPSLREESPLRSQVWNAERAVNELFKTHAMPYVVAIIPAAPPEAESHGGAAQHL